MRHVRIRDYVGRRLAAAKMAGDGAPGCVKALAGLGCALVPLLIAVGFAGFFASILLGVVGSQSGVLHRPDSAVAFWLLMALGVACSFPLLLACGVLGLVWGGSDKALVGRLEAGRRGEQAVVDTLAALDDRWVLFSGVAVAGVRGDIDHVLIGPPGVFAVESKNWAGDIVYDHASGLWRRTTRRNPLPEVLKNPAAQVAQAAAVLERRLGERVTPLVVFTNPEARYVGDHPTVPVVSLAQLVAWLMAHPIVLDEARIGQIENRLVGEVRR